MTAPAGHASETTVAVRGVELFARTIGEGPDVVVLHGGPGAHHDYLLPQLDALARRRRLRYYDQRGGGRSPAPRHAPLGWQEHVADLVALLDTWGLERATILGYSWGGLLALLFGVHHRDRLDRLALVSPAAISKAGRHTFERRFAERMAAPAVEQAREALRVSDLRHQDPDAYRQRAFELSVAGYFEDPARAHDLTPFRVTARTQQAVWDSLGDFDLEPELPVLRGVPAVVIHGRHDPIPLDTAERAAQAIGARLEVFEDSGHVPYVEEPDRFVAGLDDFLPQA